MLVEATGALIGEYLEALNDPRIDRTMEARDFFGKLVIES